MTRITKVIRQHWTKAALVAVALSLAIRFGNEAIWSAIVGALTAIVGITWEKHHDAKQSRHDREFELRRDYLLKLADIATLPQQMYNDLQKEGVSISDIGSKANAVAGVISQCSCIISLPTLKASLQASKVFAKSWCKLCKPRVRLEFITKRLDETAREVEVIQKDIDLLYQHATAESARAIRNLQEEQQTIMAKRSVLFGQKGDAHIELMQLVLKYTLEYAPHLTALQVAIRRELAMASESEFSLAVDVEVFSKLLEEATAQNSAEVNQFAKWVTDLATKLPSGDDSVLSKSSEAVSHS